MTPTFYGTSSPSFEDSGAGTISSYPAKQEDPKSTTNDKRQNQATTAPLYYPLSVSTQCLEEQQKDVLEVAKAVCPWLLLIPPADSDHNNALLEEEEEDNDEIKSSSSNSSSSSSTPTHEAGNDDEEDEELLRVRPLLGGLSNALYIVEIKQQKKHPEKRAAVLVRIHPDTTASSGGVTRSTTKNAEHTTKYVDDNDESTSIVDRHTETKLVTWLASQPVVPPLAPAVYGRFRNGRVEEFYSNMRPLSSGEMPLHAAAIGQRLAQLHRLTDDVLPLQIFPAEPPATRTHNTEFFDSNNNNNNHSLPGAVWQLTEKWYRLVLKTLDQQQQRQQLSSSSVTAIVMVLKEWETAWQWTRTAFQQHYYFLQSNSDTSTSNTTAAAQFCQQIVLAHMDCQSLNLLIPVEHYSRNQSKQLANNNHPHDNYDYLRVIDYEYSGLNPRAADIANTFCEMCKMNEIQAHWEHEYPSHETQDKLLRAYLRQLEHGCGDGDDGGNDKDNSSISANIISLSDLRHEVGRYTLVSHLSWTVWALLYAARHLSKCNIHNEEEGCFNYLAYAQQRMEGYRFFRARFWDNGSSP